MADIALLVVEEFERTSKRMKQAAAHRRGSVTAAGLGVRQEMPAGAGGRAAPASKTGEWGSWLAAEAAALKDPAAAAALPGVSAFDGFFSA